MVHPAMPITNLPRAKGKKGAMLLITVFIIALGTILIIGFLQLSLADLQIVRNNQYSIRALYIADAGIQDALYELGQDKNWNAGFTDKAFAGEIYTVAVAEISSKIKILTSESTVDGSFQRQIEIQTTVQGSDPPTIDYWKEL